MFSMSNSCFIAASHTPASPGSAGTYISHGILYLGSFHFSFKLGKEEIRLPLGPERRKQSLCQRHRGWRCRGVKDSWLPPSPHRHLWVSCSFCAERGRGEHRIYKPTAARKAPRATASLGEQNPPCRDADPPGKQGPYPCPASARPRWFCSGHTSRWSRRRARCPR